MLAAPIIGISTRTGQSNSPSRAPLYGVPQTYVRAVRQAGGLPVLLTPVSTPQEAAAVISSVTGLILSGGGDIAASLYGGEPSELIAMVDPERDESELLLTQAALQAGTPLLAICRGIQMLNVARGGTLYADIPTQIPDSLPHRPPPGGPYDGAAHQISIAPGSRLATILGGTNVTVNSLHHQAVRQVGQGLVVSARAPDGVIEGLELDDHPFCLGVQFHPELDTAGVGGPLFQALVQAANASRQAAA